MGLGFRVGKDLSFVLFSGGWVTGVGWVGRVRPVRLAFEEDCCGLAHVGGGGCVHVGI